MYIIHIIQWHIRVNFVMSDNLGENRHLFLSILSPDFPCSEVCTAQLVDLRVLALRISPLIFTRMSTSITGDNKPCQFLYRNPRLVLPRAVVT